jgi:hypothetical protein
MKRAFLAGLMLLSVTAYAEQGKEGTVDCPPPPPASKELEQIKALAGRWEGPAPKDSGHGDKVVAEYRVVSGGSAVTETMSPGTPHEMVSVYHDVNGKLMMDHYCMLGNSPQMELKSSEPGRVTLAESASSQATHKGQMRMDGVTLTRDGDTLKHSWTGKMADGSAMPGVDFELKKVA